MSRIGSRLVPLGSGRERGLKTAIAAANPAVAAWPDADSHTLVQLPARRLGP